MRINRIDYRILVTGFFNAGKTTLIHSLDSDAMSIESPLTELTKQQMKLPLNFDKTHTTTGFDRGVVCWVRPNLYPETTGVIMSVQEYSEESQQIHDEWHVRFVELKGVPGQLHFKPVREIMSTGSFGAIFIVDGADIGNIGNAIAILAETRLYLSDKPIVIVANKADLPEYNGEDYIGSIMGEKVYEGSALYNIGFKDAIIKLLQETEFQAEQKKILIAEQNKILIAEQNPETVQI